MNCLSRQRDWLILLVVLAGCGAPASESRSGAERYGLTYSITPEPVSATVLVELTVTQDRGLLRQMQFDAESERIGELDGDGRLSITDGKAIWTPPADGGVLRWRATVTSRRNDNGHDAWLGPDWGLFRAEDIIPRAATRTLRGARSDTRMRFHLPRSWSVVTEYSEANSQFAVAKNDRRFAQPSGWVVMGEIGVRRETIAGTRVAIAAPENQDVRRMDMLALLNWALPELAHIVQDMPERLTIVSAGAPMWRGALSAPQSMYIHADRPLISENGTSTLLHEVLHVAIGASAAPDFDWIVEGLAEYYSLQLLTRSGSITRRRYERALAQQQAWARDAERLCAQSSTGPSTALAVTVFAALDAEIRTHSDNDRSLDDVVRRILSPERPLDLDLLRTAARNLIGQNPDALHIDRLPGCRSIAATSDLSD